MISEIAKMLSMHPQTLRLYERHGLITPARTKGNTRLYSWQDLQQIRAILYLTRTRGVNLAGVEIILSMQRKIAALQRDIDALRQGVREQSVDAATCHQRALTKAVARTLVRVRSDNP
jgi:MerR family transcriptional regulator/heat shock protein HspR